MPIEVGIWNVSNGVKRVNFTPIASEKKLEEILEKDISIISDDLLLVGRQIPTAYGKYIDLLAIDQEGNIVIMELKKQRTPRDVVAQIIDYASWIQSLSYDEIVQIYEDNNGAPLEEAFIAKFNTGLPEEINKSHQMIIVSAELDYETERIIQYLSTNYGVPVNAVFFRYFKEGPEEFISRSWLIDPNVVEEKSSISKQDNKKEKWNQQDFVVNFDDDQYRSWSDAVKYGFVSAGNGKWYSRTLDSLFVGARVFCMIPKSGYVAVGKVTSSSVPLKDAEVEVDGVTMKLIDCDLQASNMKHDLNDLDRCEYVVRIEWTKTVTKEDAFWIAGLRANQNSANKLRHQYTIEKVSEFFGL
ncbi:recombinase RecB [Tumebacillus algifaecis]|uniref:Recombinase RecB n=1 Tax=Tumebacillus algifaecis TaxID=1214604 RepID=A0A223CWC8_9BACL|nr:endonuclease NucS domain-containing protein [Tumebacillus algifaecis]ASS73626.1 recombinase RecB [Tumebacillus algifaecis]